MQLSPTVSFQVNDEIAHILIDNPPVNALSGSVVDGLNIALKGLATESKVKIAILSCIGRGFIAGADLKEIASGKSRSEDAAAMVNRLAKSTKPIIAAVHGNALGGGFETALACDYRIALASARFGLPEVNLGVCPAFGGTQRLPRLIDFKAALDMMLRGKPITASKALELGAVDKIVEGEVYDDLLLGATNYAHQLLQQNSLFQNTLFRHKGLRKVDDKRIENIDVEECCAESLLWSEKNRSGEEVPAMIIQAVRNASELPIEEGLAFERECAQARVIAPQSLAMRHLFFSERTALKKKAVALYLNTDIFFQVERKDIYHIGYRLFEPVLQTIRAFKDGGMSSIDIDNTLHAFDWQIQIDELPLSDVNTINLEHDNVVKLNVLDSCVQAMHDAGNVLLGENNWLTSADIDVLSCNAYGFPRYRGGIMYYSTK